MSESCFVLKKLKLNNFDEFIGITDAWRIFDFHQTKVENIEKFLMHVCLTILNKILK